MNQKPRPNRKHSRKNGILRLKNGLVNNLEAIAKTGAANIIRTIDIDIIALFIKFLLKSKRFI